MVSFLFVVFFPFEASASCLYKPFPTNDKAGLVGVRNVTSGFVIMNHHSVIDFSFVLKNCPKTKKYTGII